MSSQDRSLKRRQDWHWVALSLLVLATCLYYSLLSTRMNLGFVVSAEWQIISVGWCAPDTPEELCLKADDWIVAIGDRDVAEAEADRSVPPFEELSERGEAEIRVLRDGVPLTLKHQLEPASLTPGDLWTILFPLVFWLMGTAGLLLLRPRDERWLMLVAFSYVNAIWFATGSASFTQIAYSAYVFHVFIWLFLPVTVHLHLILPDPLLGRWRRPLLFCLYGSALVLIVLDAAFRLPVLRLVYAWTFLLGVAISLAVLIARQFLPAPPGIRLANRLLLFGVVAGFGPLILMYTLPELLDRVVYFDTITQTIKIIALLAVPICPISYLYAIYKHELGALQFRANRLLGLYSFLCFYVVVYAGTFFLVGQLWVPMDGDALLPTLALSVLFVAGAPFLRDRFQLLIDRLIFGIRYSPDQVLSALAERIPTAINRTVLARVIIDGILPTLLVRQSALYLLEEGEVEPLYQQAVPQDGRLRDEHEVAALLASGGRYLPLEESVAPHFSWIRLVLPLSIQDETIGVWLFGRRDPDDYYPKSDISLLSTLASQAAAVAQNVRLYERAQQEISQRKRAEEEIRRSEERFRNLFEATFEGIALVLDGRILEVNRSLLATFGFSAGELIGQPLSRLLHDDQPSAIDLMPTEGEGIRKDGSRLAVEVAVKEYLFEGENVNVVAIRDITRRKSDEAENRRLQQELLHAQKMEAIGRLSAGVAHDFNNCLLAILGYSDLLIARYADDATLIGNLQGIKDAGEKAAALTRQLLAFSRKQPMEARPTDLNDVVTDVEKMLTRLIGGDVELATDLAGDLPTVRTDPGQMGQVVINLAVNARDAMPRGGTLTIATSRVDIEQNVPRQHANLATGTYALLTVRDTGDGIPPAIKRRIFEPFFTTKEVGKGTGLGLSTVYGTVRQSDGQVFVDSEPGQGTTFSIYLPANGDVQPESVKAEPVSERGDETILVVEDEDDVREVVRRILERKGYRVLVARGGTDALELSRRHGEAIDLLLTDVVMPQLKGPDLAAKLASELPELKVLYMSGYHDEETIGRQLSEQQATCIQKPFSARSLVTQVRRMLDGAA